MCERRHSQHATDGTANGRLPRCLSLAPARHIDIRLPLAHQRQSFPGPLRPFRSRVFHDDLSEQLSGAVALPPRADEQACEVADDFHIVGRQFEGLLVRLDRLIILADGLQDKPQVALRPRAVRHELSRILVFPRCQVVFPLPVVDSAEIVMSRCKEDIGGERGLEFLLRLLQLAFPQQFDALGAGAGCR